MFEGASKPTLVVAALIGALALFVAGFLIAAEMRSAVASPAAATNGKIAFVRHRDGNQEIYVMDADGTDQTNLTNDSVNDDYSPVSSPDGTKIAFIKNLSGNPEVYVMNADGSGQTNLTNNPADDWEPTWLPLPSAVGGTGELPPMAGIGGSPSHNYAVAATLALVAAGAFAAGGWYARRRWLR